MLLSRSEYNVRVRGHLREDLVNSFCDGMKFILYMPFKQSLGLVVVLGYMFLGTGVKRCGQSFQLISFKVQGKCILLSHYTFGGTSKFPLKFVKLVHRTSTEYIHKVKYLAILKLW